MASHRLGELLVSRRGSKLRRIITFTALMKASTASASVSFTEYPMPSANSDPLAITLGPDGNLWFTECAGNKIGRITPAGAVVEYPLPTSDSCPKRITLGPDGNLWFTEQIEHVGRITPQGLVVEYPIDAIVHGITTGPDGNLWITDGIDRVGRLTTSGVITWFSHPHTNLPQEIVSGPDGNLWFTEFQHIGRITPDGAIQEFALRPSNPVAMRYEGIGIARGADGNLWFTEEESAFDPSVSVGRNVGRITRHGDITLFAIPGTRLQFHYHARTGRQCLVHGLVHGLAKRDWPDHAKRRHQPVHDSHRPHAFGRNCERPRGGALVYRVRHCRDRPSRALVGSDHAWRLS